MSKKPFWDTKDPSSRSKTLSSEGVKRAKAMARANGRPYPNLVDNAAAAKLGLTKK